MNEYTASNGIELRVNDEGALERRNPEGTNQWDEVRRIYLRESVVSDALREFFRAERDEELGRWRWPDNPDYVVYPQGPEASVVHEPTGAWGQWARAEALYERGMDNLAAAARAYFDAHPEPKPWHDAKPGEVWELTVEGGGPRQVYVHNDQSTCGDPAAITSDGSFIELDYPGITAGRRIFPESV